MKRLLLALLLVVTTACSDDETSNSETPDAGSDAATSDAGDVSDAEVPTDSELPTDMATSDAGQDMASPADMGTDADDSDASLPDAAAGEGCAAGTTRTVGVDGVIVACARTGETVNQCDAGDLCGAGWHMCTASEYRAQYEAMEPPAVADGTFWLASCIRDGADAQAPSDQVCSDCTGQNTGAEIDLAFSCVNNVRASSEQLYVGVRAGSACAFVGNTDAGNDAYWSAQPSSTLQSGAFCCPD